MSIGGAGSGQHDAEMLKTRRQPVAPPDAVDPLGNDRSMEYAPPPEVFVVSHPLFTRFTSLQKVLL
ncbi:MAG: hypothetical protein KAV82_07730 [Phycisphaerae bacterium]|nr:hypothetical protein [Phycisphaerae bacterium]